MKLFLRRFIFFVFMVTITLFALKQINVFADQSNDDFESYYQDIIDQEWGKPGLYKKDGTPHTMKTEVAPSGRIINVLDYGANGTDPNFDNTDAFDNAVVAANSYGDTLYIPNGTYYFKTVCKSNNNNNYNSHISLRDKNGIIIKGESKENTILVSNFEESLNYTEVSAQTSVLTLLNSNNMVIENLTVTSVETRMPDINEANTNNSYFKAPKIGITVDCNSASKTSSNNVIRNVLVERFRRYAIRVQRSNNSTVINSTIQNAITLGDGGHGYGILVQGKDNSLNNLEQNQDSVFNLVTNNTIIGPYIRHGILLQYSTHNNLVTNNTIDGALLDAIDLHGENEFSNEISYNIIKNTRAGAGVGVGNTGAGHSASGINNFIYKNQISKSLRGIDVIEGTMYTILQENDIFDLEYDKSIGIRLYNASKTYILGNNISNIYEADYGFGLRIEYKGDSSGPLEEMKKHMTYDVIVAKNSFNKVQRAVYVHIKVNGLALIDNTYTNIGTYEFYDNTKNFTGKDILVYPEIILQSQLAKDNTAIRFIGTIYGVEFDQLEDAEITLVLTLNGTTKDLTINIVYLSVNNTKYECLETYYVVVTITGLSEEEVEVKSILDAQILVTIGQQTYYSNISSNTIDLELDN